MFLLLLLAPLLLFSTPICHFSPPPGWEFALPKNLSPHIQVGFIGKGSSDFRPSINLALEEVDVSLKEYVKSVKKIHLSQPNTTWRDLGKFKQIAGEGRLTEISSRSGLGEVKMLQAIFIKDHKAYILTAAVEKKDYPNFYPAILQSLQSLTLSSDLIAALPREELRQRFSHLYSSLTQEPEEDLENWKKTKWEELQKIVLEECPEMGGHWQFLALKEGYTKIYSQKLQ